MEHYKNEKNAVVLAIAESVEKDHVFKTLSEDVQIVIIEALYSSYKDGWNNAKILLKRK